MKKTLSAFVFLSLLITSLCFVSCASDSIVPGSGVIEMENLHIEYMNLGDSYYELKKYDKAEMCYKKASSSKTLYWPCLYKLAEIYTRLSKWNLAEETYKKLISRDNDNNALKESYAYVLASQGQFESALNVYKEIEEREINNNSELNVSCLENYLILLISLERNEEAKEKLAVLSEKAPDNTNLSAYKEKLYPPEPESENDSSETKNPDQVNDPDSDESSSSDPIISKVDSDFIMIEEQSSN